MIADVPNPVFSAFSFIGFILVLIPFYWHLEAWNTGTCLYMGWTAVQLLNLFINSVVWNNNAINWAPVWCDISIRIWLGTNVAILVASLCINRRLYHISKVEAVVITRTEKQRAVMIDLLIGLGIPFLQMILSYIVQGHRFDIYEDIGCFPFIYNTWPAYPLSLLWPLIISIVSAIYAVLAIRQFAQRRAEFGQFISVHNNLTSSRYFRLMALSGVEILCGIPLSIYSIYLNLRAGLSPWISWTDTHFDFSRVGQYPAVVWKSSPLDQASLESSRWFPVICAFIFFAFFGFADEAIKHYRLVYVFIAKRFGFDPSMNGSKMSGSSVFVGSKPRPPQLNMSNAALPIFVTPHRKQYRDSDLSFSDKFDSVIIIGDAYSCKDSYEGKPLPKLPHPSEALELHWPEDHAIDLSSVPQHDADAPVSVRQSLHLGVTDIV